MNRLKSLREYIDQLKALGEIQEIDAEVDWNLEMGAIIRRTYELQAPAPLFNSIRGIERGFRVLGAPAGASRQKGFSLVRAAISLGLPGHRILFRHLIPNVLGPIIIYATLTFPEVMLLEAVLSFLGLGVQPPLSSWGVLIDEGSRTMETSIWLLVCPAFFFSLTLFSLNFLGDGLRDALDPKAAKD